MYTGAGSAWSRWGRELHGVEYRPEKRESSGTSSGLERDGREQWICRLDMKSCLRRLFLWSWNEAASLLF
ncbi:hypothetical protein MA16_Dca027574 [Dendrobium catenatum]|uniref:Uncharacterized protein n=1 Tax=Dendrobium catenatum TaxID=906689 RepID=A0A2I0WWL7_9ASPA|nr:hypothetical protein MA16_Dca027574 [Dendrobium catenatum]